MPYQLILNTCPDFAVAQTLAKQIVENKLAACVNILPALTSVYRWQGKVETAQEHLLLIKASSTQYSKIEQFINTHHPYDVPEIIAFSIENGLPAYLQWIDSCATLK
ncbi:MAG: divalent cation tolerance protein CutA [Methyloprofundus sp.]|nr:divalent cation tolerance protein CutA [Methyloprofundus sp.]